MPETARIIDTGTRARAGLCDDAGAGVVFDASLTACEKAEARARVESSFSRG